MCDLVLGHFKRSAALELKSMNATVSLLTSGAHFVIDNTTCFTSTSDGASRNGYHETIVKLDREVGRFLSNQHGLVHGVTDSLT